MKAKIMGRMLFCEISPLTYKISREKCIFFRKIKDKFSGITFAKQKIDSIFPYTVYEHKSVIRRKLAGVDETLQNNKAENLRLAIPKISKIIIQKGETFSFWKIIGRTTAAKGYLNGLQIKHGEVSVSVGGGMCAFTNMIHWLVLHSDLKITEHHHHGQLDLFPDDNRKVPFGTGTSIMYNYIDYRFRNDSPRNYQLIFGIDGDFFRGELRSDKSIGKIYEIYDTDNYYYLENDVYYRHNIVYRKITDISDNSQTTEKIIENNAKVCYDYSLIPKDEILQNV
jgi:vancomycin resistance protein VanW